ncbi:MAG: hypothetical protein A2V66_10575 [Ignavibacteria bacterium RBG_13_36_8]|nr:MAG: hypothetical protein A2V66_10575 [Ignavibacteria bacterium RBG_13_36_8]
MIFDYLQIPIIPIVFLELFVAVGITVTVYRIIPKGFRLVSGVGTIIGLFSGVMLWYGLLGPILLPK